MSLINVNLFFNVARHDLLIDSAIGPCFIPVTANSIDSEDGRPHIFRSYETYGDTQSSARPPAAAVVPLWQVARATSAAPMYFSPITIEDKSYVDGGLGTNNPRFRGFL
jgi:predicted acylesterase/phospholipase RssA